MTVHMQDGAVGPWLGLAAVLLAGTWSAEATAQATTTTAPADVSVDAPANAPAPVQACCVGDVCDGERSALELRSQLRG